MNEKHPRTHSASGRSQGQPRGQKRSPGNAGRTSNTGRTSNAGGGRASDTGNTSRTGNADRTSNSGSMPPNNTRPAKQAAPAAQPPREAGLPVHYLKQHSCDVADDSLVAIGKVLKPHGVYGEIRTLILTDFPERFEETEQVYLVSPRQRVLLFDVESVRYHSNWILLKLVDIDTPEDVGLFRNWLVSVPEDELVELEEGEYWHFQLEGLQVFDPNGTLLGTFREVIETPGHDIYAITTPTGGELLIPAVEEYIISVDLENKKIVAKPPQIG